MRRQYTISQKISRIILQIYLLCANPDQKFSLVSFFFGEFNRSVTVFGEQQKTCFAWEKYQQSRGEKGW